MPIQTVNYNATDAPQQFVDSLRHTGFAVLKHHPLPESLVNSIYQNWEAFFNSADKYNYRYNQNRMDGFFPATVSETAKGSAQKDLKEYFHFYHPWGQCPADLQEELVSYHDKVTALASELLTWVEQESPPTVAARYSEPLSQMITGSEQTLLRILHYPPLQGDIPAGAMRAAAHEDINLLTLLPAANRTGLQVRTPENTWLDVPCDFGLLIVNSGDMLQEASGGYFPSATHRVINPSSANMHQSRLSLPLFLHPRPAVILSPRYTAESYLQERLRELGLV